MTQTLEINHHAATIETFLLLYTVQDITSDLLACPVIIRAFFFDRCGKSFRERQPLCSAVTSPLFETSEAKAIDQGASTRDLLPNMSRRMVFVYEGDIVLNEVIEQQVVCLRLKEVGMGTCPDLQPINTGLARTQ